MSKTAKQLQTPYTVRAADSWILDAAGNHVAVMTFRGIAHQHEEIAHAEAIVHALNCHDDLMEACKAVAEAPRTDDGATLIFDRVREKIHTAIAKAEPVKHEPKDEVSESSGETIFGMPIEKFVSAFESGVSDIAAEVKTICKNGLMLDWDIQSCGEGLVEVTYPWLGSRGASVTVYIATDGVPKEGSDG